MSFNKNPVKTAPCSKIPYTKTRSFCFPVRVGCKVEDQRDEDSPRDCAQIPKSKALTWRKSKERQQ